MLFTTVQHISAERLALYAEHARLCEANIHDREANERRQAVWNKLVKSPVRLDSRSEFVKDDDGNVIEQIVHITWRE